MNINDMSHEEKVYDVLKAILPGIVVAHGIGHADDAVELDIRVAERAVGLAEAVVAAFDMFEKRQATVETMKRMLAEKYR